MNKIVRKVYQVLISPDYVNAHLIDQMCMGLHASVGSIIMHQVYLGCKDANIVYLNKGYSPIEGYTTKKSFNRFWNGIFQKRMLKAAKKIVGAGKHTKFFNDLEDGGPGFYC